MPDTWVVATSNAGKLREFEHALAAVIAHRSIRLVSQSALGISGADEPYDTFEANAVQKARHASAASGLPALADDSGLCVDALQGAPGVWSARFARRWVAAQPEQVPEQAEQGQNNSLRAALSQLPEDEANLQLALHLMHDKADRSASFHCVIAFVRHADDPHPILASGVWKGQIARAPVGEHGFGYDPIFFDPVLGKTAAQLSLPEKERVSHRGQALRAFVHALSNAA